MKKLIIGLLLFGSAYSGYSQFVINKKDLPEKNKVYKIYRSEDSFFSNDFDLGEGKANESYDLSKLSNYDFDTVDVVFKSPSEFGFDAAHPAANLMNITESQTGFVRPELKLDAKDFPSGAGKTKSTNVVGTNGFTSLNHEVRIDRESRANARYECSAFSIFPTTNEDLEYLNPSSTPGGSAFTSADAAQLIGVETDVNNTEIVRAYEFYDNSNGDFMSIGYGISYDQGALGTGTPSGVFKDVSTKPDRNKVHISENWKPGDTYSDTVNWRVEIKELFTTLIHRERHFFFKRVVGTGVLNLPNDSFEVMAIANVDYNVSYDTIQSPLGNTTEQDIDSQITVQFWAPKVDRPIATLYYYNTDFDSIMYASYLDMKNPVKVSDAKEVDLIKFHSAYNLTDDGLDVNGITVLVDQGALFFGAPTGKLDTAHATYSKPYRFIGKDFKYGANLEDKYNWKVTLLDGDFSHEETTTRTNTVDGYGKVWIDGDSIPVLRIKTLEAQVVTDIFIEDGVPNEDKYTDSLYYLTFFAQNNGIPFIRMEMSEDWDEVWSVEFTDNPDITIGRNKPVASSIEVYPNPANTHFTIEIPESSEFLVSLTSMDGKTVLERQMSQGQHTVNTENLQKGLYLVKTLNLRNNNSRSSKLLIE